MQRTFHPLAVAAAVLAALVGRLHAQPLIEHVPDDAVVYIGWRGADAAGEAYNESNLKGVLDATQFQAIISQFLPALQQQAASDPQAQQVLQMVRDAAPIMWQRPWALYVVEVPSAIEEGEIPVNHVGFLIEAGDDADTVRSLFEKAAEAIRRSFVHTRVIEADGVLALVWGPEPVESIAPADSGKRSLKAAKDFQQAWAQVDGSSAIIVYCGVDEAVDLIDKLAETDRNKEDFAAWHRIRNALGLSGIKQFIYTAGFDGKDWRSQAFLHMPAPRPDTGLPALFAGRPITDADLKLVPRTATWMQAARFDTGRLLDVIRGAVQAGDEEAAGSFDAGLAQTSLMTGVDIENDLLRSLGDTWLLYSDPAVAGPMGYGMVLVNPLKDAAKVEAAFAQLEQLANAQMAQGGGGPFGGVRFKTMTSGDMEIHSLTFPMFAPSWAVKDGNLYVAVFPQAIVSANLYANQNGASILDNEKFQAVRARLGAHPATSISFADLPATAGAAYQSYLMLTQMLTAMMPGEDAPTMLLPPLGQIMPFVTPAGSIAWTDDAGWHFASTSPFPGSLLLSQQAMMNPFGGGAAVSAMGVGILLPALGTARETARAAQSMSNLRQIGLALHMHLNDHDAWPTSLSSLVPDYAPTLDMFVHPEADVFVPDIDGLSQERLANWFANNSSYIYVHPVDDWEKIDNPSKVIVLFERPDFATDAGLAAAYVDGHAERRPLREIANQLREQTGKSIDEWTADAKTAQDPTPTE